MAVRIVTDSASGIGEADVARLDLTVVHLHVIADDRDLSEQELLAPAFYDRLGAMDALPKTSQPSPEQFSVVFRRLLDEGHEVLAVLISAGMSGTVESAELARAAVLSERPDARIEVVDSRSNSMEEAFAVLAAAEAAAAGLPIEACRAAAEETIRRTRFLFTPHTLEYLRRGGRMSGASALVSVALKIAPILTAHNGATGVAGVARSGRAARAKVAALMRKDIERHGLKRVAVQYIVDEEEARRFAADVVEPIAGTPVPIAPIHPVVGLHVGPAVGVVYETAEPLR
ncbi:MAG: DegV family protein [Coriobacteriia bacterium]|nr:DegV family protein [Coriobacteriia bacterium]